MRKKKPCGRLSAILRLLWHRAPSATRATSKFALLTSLTCSLWRTSVCPEATFPTGVYINSIHDMNSDMQLADMALAVPAPRSWWRGGASWNRPMHSPRRWTKSCPTYTARLTKGALFQHGECTGLCVLCCAFTCGATLWSLTRASPHAIGHTWLRSGWNLSVTFVRMSQKNNQKAHNYTWAAVDGH